MRDDGSVACFGDNRTGALGDGTKQARTGAVIVPGLRAAAVASGSGQSCAVDTDGKVRWWGGAHVSPTQVAGVEGAVSVAMGGAHTCAVLRDASLHCWGQNFSGELGDGTSVQRSSPVRVPLADVAWVALGESHSCAAQKSGALFCWGENRSGRLGIGDQEIAGEPAMRSERPITVRLL